IVEVTSSPPYEICSSQGCCAENFELFVELKSGTRPYKGELPLHLLHTAAFELGDKSALFWRNLLPRHLSQSGHRTLDFSTGRGCCLRSSSLGLENYQDLGNQQANPSET